MSYVSAIISDLDFVHADEEDHRTTRETAQWSKELSIFNFSAQKIETLKSLHEMANLPKNWDSYESPPPTKQARDKALIFVVYHLRDGDRMPWVSPVSGGGIQLSWKKQTNELDFDILPDGKMEYVKSSGGNPIEVDEKFSLDSARVQSMLDWVR